MAQRCYAGRSNPVQLESQVIQVSFFRVRRALAPAILLAACLTVGPGCAHVVPAPMAAAPAAPTEAAATTATEEPAVGVPVRLEVAYGERAIFPLYLPGPTFLHLRLDNLGMDATLTLRGPGGETVAASHGEEGRWAEEYLVAAPEEAGTYLLTVEPVSGETGRAGVAFEVLERRPLAPGDDRRVTLTERYAAALALAGPEPKLSELQAVAEGFAEIGDLRGQARALSQLGWSRFDSDPLTLDDVAAARRDFGRTRELWAEAGDAAGEADALDDLARLRLATGELDEARRLLDRAGERARASGRPGPVAMVENTLGAVAQYQGRLEEALTHYRLAAEHYQRADDLRNYAVALMGMGMIERKLGSATSKPATGSDAEGADGQAAVLGCLKVEEAMRLARELRFERSPLYLNYGLCQRSRGRGDAAHSAYTAALSLARRQGDDDIHGKALFHLGSLLAELGDYESGRRRLEEARELLSAEADLQVDVETYLGWIAVLEGRPEEGLESFRRALEREPENRTAWLGWGDALLAMDRPREALEPLAQALMLSRLEGVQRSEAEALRKIGTAHLEMGDLAAAREALTAALAMSLDEAQVEGSVRSRLARLLTAEGRPAEALEQLRRAMKIREETRSTISLPEVRATYLSRWREDFMLLIDLLMRTGAPAVEALEASERAHARTLQELLLKRRRDGAAGGPPELLRARRRAEERESRLVSQLVSGRPGEAEERRLSAQLRGLQDELQNLEWRIQQAAAGQPPGAGDDPDPGPLTLEGIQALLGEGEALLEYALGEKRSVLFVVTRDGLSVHADLPPAAVLAADVEAMRRQLEQVQPHRMHLLPRVGHRLYRHLLAPAEAELAGVERLIVVPDRELFYLPFEALARDGGAAPEWAVDRWEMSYVPAATVLTQLQRQRRQPRQPPPDSASDPRRPADILVAFADSRGGATGAGDSTGEIDGAVTSRTAPGGYGPLPAARREVAEIANLLPPGRSTVYVGEAASMTNLLDPAVATADWLHFAVHGFFDDRRPDISGLMLAQGELRSTAIRELDLDAELVVLSACQTGLGREVWGEELIGLSRAFFAAGAPTVVVSLWRVADRSTATLMVEFYRGLLDGLGPRAALTGAKRRLRADGLHPYHWAPFIVIGRPDFASEGNDSQPGSPVSDDHLDNPDPEDGSKSWENES